MTNQKYEEILRTMPLGLNRAVLRELTFHIGEYNGIERGELHRKLREMKATQATTDRQMRISIQYWRIRGVRICQSERQVKEPGKPIYTIFTYHLAGSEAEYQKFRLRYKKYANTINTEVEAMDTQQDLSGRVNDDVPAPPEGFYQPEMI